MICEPLGLGVSLIRQMRHTDARGHFSRLWCADDLARAGLLFHPVQTSLSVTLQAGTLRGMHWQAPPFAEGKLVHVLRGRIFDVAASLEPVRSGPRFVARALGPGEALFIPAGLAHGFLTLTDEVEMIYFIDRPYEPNAARGARFDDPALAIDWPSPPLLIADKDRSWPLLRA